MDASLRFTPFVVLILFTLGADQVQAEAVCSDTPAAGDRVYCEELFVSTNNINIDLDGVTIDTTAREERSVQGVHHGTGKITINVQNSSSTTQDNLADSIFGWHAGTGDVDIDVRDFTSITKGDESNGVFGLHTNMGDIDIDVWNFTSTIEGDYSYGIVGRHAHNTHGGGIDIDVFDGTFVTTKGEGSARPSLAGMNIPAPNKTTSTYNVRDSTLITEGLGAYGLYGLHQGMGDIDITARDTSITTKGDRSHGILGFQWLGMGNVFIDLVDSSVMAKGDADGTLNPYGIYGRNNAGGEGHCRHSPYQQHGHHNGRHGAPPFMPHNSAAGPLTFLLAKAVRLLPMA